MSRYVQKRFKEISLPFKPYFAYKKIISSVLFRRASILRWTDFRVPSTLQLNPLIEVLLEPVRSTTASKRLQLGLQEALVNAVRHGNNGDTSKSLRIRRILSPKWLIWQIQDEGSGLPEQARVGCLPEELDANSGRGLFLIYQCFDDVRWSRRGNRLQLACKRSTYLVGEGTQDRLFPD